MIGGEWKRAGEDRQGPLLVPFRAVSHSRWRHIRSHIVALGNVPRMCRAQIGCAMNVPWCGWGEGGSGALAVRPCY